MVLWVGVDDTDSLKGMCTTFLATELVRELTADHDLIGYPRLVRLNPNIPWKTRGNGALALRFGRGTGRPWKVGRIGGRDLLAFPKGRGDEDPRDLRSRAVRLVERWAAFDDPTTNPACVVLNRRPPASLYWKAVRGVVSRAQARRAVRGRGYVRAYKNGRGVVGAAAAVSWRPRDRTYEILAYRAESLWGTPRHIDPDSVREMDRAFPSTFNNFDYINNKVVIAPHSPCPILFGIRGDNPEDLPPAMKTIRGERPERWLLFETNQGTDDHIRPGDWSLEPWTGTAVSGTVATVPRTRSGGHVLFELQGRGLLTIVAYEPSKQFRTTVRALRPGDRIQVWGSVREEPRTLNLERLELMDLAKSPRKASNPRCPRCGKSMKSVGRDAGYRCLRCREHAGIESAEWIFEPRTIQVGTYEPPTSARRHLSKPIKRILGSAGRSDLLDREAGRRDLFVRPALPRLARPQEHPPGIHG